MQVYFVDSDKIAETLLADISADVLPETLGGTVPNDDVPCPNMPGVKNIEVYTEADAKDKGLYYHK